MKIALCLLLLFSLPLSGCMALLELGELGVVEEAEIGLADTRFGALRIVEPDLVADEVTNTVMRGDGEVGIVRNGSFRKIGTLLEGNTSLTLEDGRVLNLRGVAYRVNGEVFVRASPFNDGELVSQFKFSEGRLVIVNEAVNGWYEILLPGHLYGFIPASSATIAPCKKRLKGKIKPRTIGFRKGINYIADADFRNMVDSKEIIVSFEFPDGTFDEVASLKLSSIAGEKGYRSTPGFFSNYFYTDELGNSLRLGNVELIRKLQLTKHADYLLIGKREEHVRVNRLQRKMLACEFSYILTLIDLCTGKIEKTFADTYSSAGFGSTDARNNAMQAFYEIIAQQTF